MFVHNFAVHLKRTSLSCRSPFFCLFGELTGPLPCQCTSLFVEAARKEWNNGHSHCHKSSLGFGEKYHLHIFRISCCAQNIPQKAIKPGREKIHKTFQPSRIFSKPFTCLSLVTLYFAMSLSSVSLYFIWTWWIKEINNACFSLHRLTSLIR